MSHLIRAIALVIVFVGIALIALGVSLTILAAQGDGSSGAACVVILFIPLCFSWGSNAAAVGVLAAVISLALLVIVALLMRRFLEGLTPGE